MGSIVLGVRMPRFVSRPQNHERKAMLRKLFDTYFGVGRWFGNVFRPALTLEWRGINLRECGAWVILTYRCKHWMETKVYIGLRSHPAYIKGPDGKKVKNEKAYAPNYLGWPIWWNSDHLAKRFGKQWEAYNSDICYTWDSKWFGCHQYI